MDGIGERVRIACDGAIKDQRDGELGARGAGAVASERLGGERDQELWGVGEEFSPLRRGHQLALGGADEPRLAEQCVEFAERGEVVLAVGWPEQLRVRSASPSQRDLSDEGAVERPGLGERVPVRCVLEQPESGLHRGSGGSGIDVGEPARVQRPDPVRVGVP